MIERRNLWKMKTIASWMFTIERGNQWNQAQTHTHSARSWFSRTSWYYIVKREQVQPCNWWRKHRLQHLRRAKCDGETITWIDVHNLIQQIENHPQREALQSDLQQHRAFNPFSEESKNAITAVGNTELCEIIDVEPKSQCRSCLTYWSAGIVYCTCGHLMEDDTTENKKYIKSVLDLFSVPNFYTRKGRPHGHKYGKKEGDKEYHTANQLQKKCRKKQYKNIHDRFIRDLWFRKTMIELGRSEEVILEMDRLANEDHTHIATEEEIDVNRGNWWIRSNFVGSDTMPVRHRPAFKKALSTLHRLKKAEDKAYYQNWSQSSSSWWQWQTNQWDPHYETSPQRWSEHWLNGETWEVSETSIYVWHESHNEFGAKLGAFCLKYVWRSRSIPSRPSSLGSKWNCVLLRNV